LTGFNQPENLVLRIHCMQILCLLLNLDKEKKEHFEKVFCGNPNKFDKTEFIKNLRTLQTLLIENQ